MPLSLLRGNKANENRGHSFVETTDLLGLQAFLNPVQIGFDQ